MIRVAPERDLLSIGKICELLQASPATIERGSGCGNRLQAATEFRFVFFGLTASGDSGRARGTETTPGPMKKAPPPMTAELGHAQNRVYIDQAGNMHQNGSTPFDTAEVALTATNTQLNALAAAQAATPLTATFAELNALGAAQGTTALTATFAQLNTLGAGRPARRLCHQRRKSLPPRVVASWHQPSSRAAGSRLPQSRFRLSPTAESCSSRI